MLVRTTHTANSKPICDRRLTDSYAELLVVKRGENMPIRERLLWIVNEPHKSLLIRIPKSSLAYRSVRILPSVGTSAAVANGGVPTWKGPRWGQQR